MSNYSISDWVQLNYQHIHQPYVLAYLTITGISSLTGICGNTMTILTFMGTKALQETRNFFIINLALADLLVNGIVMPYSIFGALVGKLYFDVHPWLCRFLSTVCAPGCLASMFTICFISCARYFYICKYNVYLKYFTKSRTYIYLLCLWLMCFLIHSPNHFGWGRSDKYAVGFEICTLDMGVFSYSLFYGCWMVTAISSTFYFYFRIYQTIKNSKLTRKMITNQKMPNNKKCDLTTTGAVGNGKAANRVEGGVANLGSMDMKNEIRLIKTSFKIFLLFVTLWTPAALMILMGENGFVPKPVYLYGIWMAHSNSTVNFVIYYVDNTPFRNGFWALVKKILHIQLKSQSSMVTATTKVSTMMIQVSTKVTQVAAKY